MTPTQQLAAALVQVHKFILNRETTGRRMLFEAVNEAFVWTAKNSGETIRVRPKPIYANGQYLGSLRTRSLE